MSGRFYFDNCIDSYRQAIDLISACQFDQAKAALNEAIRWDQMYWQEADMPIGSHITEECAIAAKRLLEAIKVAEMYQEARNLANQKKINEAKDKITILLDFHSQTNFIAPIENLNNHLNQHEEKLIDYSQYAKKTADFYARTAKKLLGSISDDYSSTASHFLGAIYKKLKMIKEYFNR